MKLKNLLKMKIFLKNPVVIQETQDSEASTHPKVTVAGDRYDKKNIRHLNILVFLILMLKISIKMIKIHGLTSISISMNPILYRLNYFLNSFSTNVKNHPNDPQNIPY